MISTRVENDVRTWSYNGRVDQATYNHFPVEQRLPKHAHLEVLLLTDRGVVVS